MGTEDVRKASPCWVPLNTVTLIGPSLPYRNRLFRRTTSTGV